MRALCEPPGDNVVCGPDLHAELGVDDFGPFDLHPNGPANAWIAEALIAEALAETVPEPDGAAVALLVLALLGRRRPALPSMDESI